MKNFWKIVTKIQLDFLSYRHERRDMDTALRSDPSSQQEAKIWKKSSEKTPTRPQLTRSVAKIIMTIFWDREGVLLVDFLPCGSTINDPYYASLYHRLRFSTREKCRGRLRYGVLLLDDNAPFHQSNITQASPKRIILHILQTLHPIIIICSQI